MRIDIYRLPIILVRTERHRLAKAAVRALMFPGINDQIVFFKMVIRTCETCSTALGALANFLTFTNHFLVAKESFGPFFVAASPERSQQASRGP